MPALADDAALARLVIAAARIPRHARSRWLHCSNKRNANHYCA
jgi:hypothetical protein